MKDEISLQIARASVIHKQIVSSLNTNLADNQESIPPILISPTLFMTERKINSAVDIISSRINSTQYQLLVQSCVILFSETQKLANVCGFSISELNLLSAADEDIWRGYSLKKLVRTYLQLRAMLESFLLEIYGPLNDLYSYYRIPEPKAQSFFLQDTNELKMGDELTFIDIDGAGKKTEGYPDMLKFKQLEVQDYFLAMELSIASQTIVSDEYLQEMLTGYQDSSVRILVNQVLEEMYNYAYRSIYEQIYTAQSSWDRIKDSTLQKYQSVFIKSLVSKISELAADATVKELIEAEQQLLADLMKELQSGLTQPSDLFDLEAARVYRVDIRENNAFEMKNLKTFFSADIYLYEAIVGYKDVLVDCYSLGYSPLTYKIIEGLLN